MNIGGFMGLEMDKEAYAAVQTAFIRVLLEGFDELFDVAAVTAFALDSDTI